MQQNEAPDAGPVIDACRRLQADAAALELADRTIIVAMNVYDGTCAVASCDPGASLPAMARGLQVRLYSESSGDGPAGYLPAATVRSALREWERQISLVFGRRYASGLVNGVTGTIACGEMTGDHFEIIRRQLMIAIGGCIELKVKK